MTINTLKLMIEGAMNLETEYLIASLESPQEYLMGSWRFIEGHYRNLPLVIAVTSVGMSNAAAATALGIEYFHPTAIINQGTAGGHTPALKAYDIVLAQNSFDASSYRTAKEDNTHWRHMNLMGTYAYNSIDDSFLPQDVYYKSDPIMLDTAWKVGRIYHRGQVIAGTIASCNTWNRQKERIQYLHDTFGSSCEDMETASVALVCQQYKVPFLGIRIISNNELNDEDFQPDAAKICQQFVLDVVHHLPQ